MQSVSAAFKTAILGTERQIKKKVEIYFLDNSMISGSPSYSASSTRDAVYTPASAAFDGKSEMELKYAWIGSDIYPSVDTYPVPSGGQVGWWSNTLSDGSGNFAVAETLAIDYGVSQILTSMHISCDEWFGYPVNFQIHYATVASPGGGDWTLVTSVTGNANASWVFAPPAQITLRHLRLSITKWSAPNKCAKILEMDMGYNADVSSQVKSFSITKERNADDESTSLPYGNSSANELRLVLDNTSGNYFTRNTSGPYYGYLKTDRKVKVWLGVVLANGTIEYVPQGTYYTVGWQAALNSPEVTIIARDEAKRMMDMDFSTSTIYEDQTVSQLANLIATAYGLGVSSLLIDATTEVLPYAYFEKAKYWTHLNALAAGEGGAIYFDENGKLVFENRAHMFGARLTAQANPGATSLTLSSVYGLTPSSDITIDNGSTHEDCFITAAWDGVSHTVPLDVGISGTYPINSYLYRKTEGPVATFDISDVITDITDEYVLDKARNKIEVSATPLVVPKDGAGNPVREYVWELDEGITVPASSHTDIDVFFTKDGVLNDVTYPLGYTITTQVGGDQAFITTSWQPTSSYAWGGHLRISNSKGSPVTVIGLRIDGVPLSERGGIVETAKDTALISEQGERAFELKSRFIQRRSHAAAIAASLLAAWKDPGRAISIPNSIGLPHLQLADRIRITDGIGLANANLNNHFFVTRISLDFDGGLSASYDCTPA